MKENNEYDTTINPDYPIQPRGKKYFQDRIKKDYALVAIINNRIVGYLVGGIYNMEDYRNISKIAEAENMFVLDDFRSFGIGKKLLQEFTKQCKSKKIKKIKVVASAKNKRAIEFYRREGFKDYDLVLEKDI